jgi:diaminopimelate decarboxylase
MFNVESEGELELLNRVAAKAGTKARVALRINPDVDPRTHPHISTGLKSNKFGIEPEKARAIFRDFKSYASLELTGLDCHIGSQLLQMEPIVEALSHLVELVVELKQTGIAIKYLDLGGGLGISYNNEQPPLPAEYAREISAVSQETGCKLILEPGRVIVGNAGILLLKVVFLKETGAKRFVIADGGMNDLIRPALYGAYHEVLPVLEQAASKNNIVDLVGPICESADFLAKDRPFPMVKPGELLAVMSAGAYGFVMASNYNTQPLPAEVLVSGRDFHLVRARQSYEHLLAPEKIPEFLLKDQG